MVLRDLCPILIDLIARRRLRQETGTRRFAHRRWAGSWMAEPLRSCYRIRIKTAAPVVASFESFREAPVGNASIRSRRLALPSAYLLIRPSLHEPVLHAAYQGTIHGLTNGVTVPHLNMDDVSER